MLVLRIQFVSEDVLARLAWARSRVEDDLGTLIEGLLWEHCAKIEAVAREMKPRPFCETQHYEEFITRELVDRALIYLTEKGELDALLG